MSEEIRNSGMEMNDAALEGVSGGSDYTMGKAKEYCKSCAAHKKSSGPVYCAGGVTALAEFLEWNAMRNGCPYYRVDNSNRGSVG